ncbi:MAG TPA: hypothetical protein VK177_15680 [Flavobacteriales bacterium]|nr:hypothetical protein [Flavobacteriales bacterium]
MKTVIFFLFIALWGGTRVCAQQHAMELHLQTVLAQNELAKRKQNRVKSVEEITRVSRTHREFDRNGKPLHAVVYFKDQPLITTGYTYDNKGNAIEKRMENASGIPTMVVTCTYDEHENTVSEITSPANEPEQKVQWFYNEKRKPVKEIRDVYLFAQTFTYEYDAEGKRIKTTETNSEFEGAEWISVFDYNTASQMTGQKWFRIGQPDTSYCFAKYDTQGNLSEITTADAITESRQVFTWSAKGELLKKQEWFKFPGQFYKTEADYMEEYEYDENGNVVKTITTETADKRVTVVEFVYGFYEGN